MWLLTINNPATGDELSKPAMYIDGNIHANEVQGGETALYTVDYVLKNYGKLEPVTELLDRAAFYVIPMVNPDGRARWFKGPSTPNFPRTVMVPVDDDRDGVADEDGYDDLDGDGVITQMRKKVPLGTGNFKLDPKDPRIVVPIEGDELGDYVLLGTEGIDNDGDGLVNEDTIGYVDPNRTWGYFWQPRYVQAGAGDYPLQIPETRAIALWALDHPNIGAVQSYHNNGQMILRGPGSKLQPKYPPSDIRAYDLIGDEGEKLLPGYDYYVTWKDLYTVYGDTTDHFYNIHGADRADQRALRRARRLRRRRRGQPAGGDEVQRPPHPRAPVRRLEGGRAPAVRHHRGRWPAPGRGAHPRGLGARGGDPPQQRLRPLPRPATAEDPLRRARR